MALSRMASFRAKNRPKSSGVFSEGLVLTGICFKMRCALKAPPMSNAYVSMSAAKMASHQEKREWDGISERWTDLPTATLATCSSAEKEECIESALFIVNTE